MGITGGIVLYAVFWFICLYMILPLFVRNQEEAGDVVPGTSAGAPDEPLMRKKLIWTTISASVVWVVVFAFIQSEIVTVEDISRWVGPPE
ncbi:MAG: DUF1467 family protein [Pseudomonadota bacterium]